MEAAEEEAARVEAGGGEAARVKAAEEGAEKEAAEEGAAQVKAAKEGAERGANGTERGNTSEGS